MNPFLRKSFGHGSNAGDRYRVVPGHRCDRERCRNILIDKKGGDEVLLMEGDLAQERLDIP